MPIVAEMVDEIRKVFPEARVIYAKEGKVEVGKPTGKTQHDPRWWFDAQT